MSPRHLSSGHQVKSPVIRPRKTKIVRARPDFLNLGELWDSPALDGGGPPPWTTKSKFSF